LFLSPVESSFKGDEGISRYTNLLLAQLKLRLKRLSARATTELTSAQNECTLASQSAVSRPEGVLDYNRHYINDLPTTSPHGSDSNTLRELLELYRFERRAWHSSATPREDVSILESFVRSFAEWIGRRGTKPESTRRRFKD
jgi:hypothetical protein